MSYTSPGGITPETVLDCIKSSMVLRGYPPTITELGECLSLSRTSVHYWLKQLEEKGLIERVPGSSRAIRIL